MGVASMDSGRIAELLQPFITDAALPAPAELNPGQLRSISTYIEFLLRWNARFNLTAVRDPESIVRRHFGEALFLAACLFPSSTQEPSGHSPAQRVLDLGSGAGFPGLPLKIYVPGLRLTLVEANHKKAAFLKEVIRALNLSGVSVFAGRVQAQPARPAAAVLPKGIDPPDIVTMRAVERFESALATAAALARDSSGEAGKVALLIGAVQAEAVPRLVPDFRWELPLVIPQSRERVLLLGVFERRTIPPPRLSGEPEE
jgi:16S rRNA (guanine527-N7)-methyltransferase